MESVDTLIRRLRDKLAMTQEEFARQVTVSVTTVNRWENAHAEPSQLAWKAIRGLARKRGLTSTVASGGFRRSSRGRPEGRR